MLDAALRTLAALDHLLFLTAVEAVYYFLRVTGRRSN